MPAGRPTVITDEVLRKLEEAFEWGCSDLEACLHAGISKTALYDYQQGRPAFAERKELLKESPNIIARKSVILKMPIDSDLALRYLERKKKDEFATRTETKHEGGIPVTLTDEQQEHLERANMEALIAKYGESRGDIREEDAPEALSEGDSTTSPAMGTADAVTETTGDRSTTSAQ